jgi:hypothetical protein
LKPDDGQHANMLACIVSGRQRTGTTPLFLLRWPHGTGRDADDRAW